MFRKPLLTALVGSVAVVLAVLAPWDGPAEASAQGGGDPFADVPGENPFGGNPFGPGGDPFGPGNPFRADPRPGDGPLATKAAEPKRRLTPPPPRAPRSGADPFRLWIAEAKKPRVDAPAGKPGVAKPRPAGPRSGEAAILAALDEPTQIEFIETPLQDVIDYLRSLHEINIVIDQRTLDDEGVGSDTPVTFNLKGVSLRSALNLMLREKGLTWTIRDEVLLITTPEEAAMSLVTKVYDVADLVSVRDEEGRPWEDYKALLYVIQDTVATMSWVEFGGQGSIEGGTFGTGKVLVISQTWPVHESVAKLLADLRAVAAEHDGTVELPIRRRRAPYEAPEGRPGCLQYPPGTSGAQPGGVMGGGFF